MSRTSVADHVIRRIAADGIDTVFSLTGGGIMYLVDAIARSDKVRLLCVHHEEFAGVAADGYARAGKPYGVAIGTTGPGAAHLFAAAAAAWQDSSPLLLIAGQVKSADASSIQGLPLRQNGTFEFDTTKAFAPVCKQVSVIRSAASAAQELERAIHLACEGRPGPVLIEIPLDVQGQMMPEVPAEAGHQRLAPTAGIVRADALESLVTHLRQASRPLVLLGAGVVRARVHERLTRVLASCGIPYVVTQFGREAGVFTHPLYLGSPGIKANRSANLALMRCDLLVALGTSLHQQVIGWDAEQFSKAPSHKIWFEMDGDTLSARRSLVDEAFASSAQDACETLMAALNPSALQTAAGWAPWQKTCADWRERHLLHYPVHAPVEGRMCLYRAISAINRHASAFSAAVTDAGIVWYALAQHYFPRPGSHYLSSGSFGAMGMALPMAIGAAAATRQPVLAVTGDGSLMMCLSELASLKASGLPVLLVVNNNNGYVSIRSTHDRYFEGRKLGTDNSNGVFIPDYRAVASTFGIAYHSADSEQSLDGVLQKLVKAGISGPVLLEIHTYVDQAVEPLVGSKRIADGRFVSAPLDEMTPAVDLSA